MSEPDWDAIASYVRIVARKAFERGYATGEANYRDDREAVTFPIPPDYEARAREADEYVRTGFDVATVRKYHPGGRT